MAECKVKGRLKEMVKDREGNWVISFTTTSKIDGDVFDDLASYECCDIEIRKHREIRSKNANAYFHVLVNKIAAETGKSDEQVKVRLITSYGALARTAEGQYLMFLLPLDADATDYYKYAVLFDQREVNGKKVNMWKVYKDSHKMNSKEMAHLIDMTIQEARDLGIDTDTPEMKKRWADYEAAHPRKETEHGTQD